ncbi:hypothetical protein [Ekhidna sp.]|uniref:hypothetical protein n=1 Tax=Ekhidna sp. TaxID=2608089 RepID=UPI003CCC267C
MKKEESKPKQYKKTRQKRFNDFLVTNRYTRKLLKIRYHSPNILKPSVSLGNESRALLEEFKENGIIKFPSLYIKECDFILNEYLEPALRDDFSRKPFMVSTLNQRGLDMGKEVSVKLSMDIPELKRLFFDENICGILYNFFQRQPYYRNQPVLVQHTYRETSKKDIQGKYHLDNGLDQVNFMLLLNDIDENDTHMEYALKSVQEPVTIRDLNRFSFEDEDIAEKYQILPLIGKKGTLYMFNAGNGYHRALYKLNTTRKILHWIVTPGHTLDGDQFERKEGWSHIKEKPAFVKSMIKKLL